MMNDTHAGNADLSAIFNLYTYLDDAVVGHNYENQKLGDIIDDLHLRVQAGDTSISDDQKNCIQIIRSAIKQNESWGDAVLLDRSTIDADGSQSVTWKDDSIQAATFKYGDDVYLSYRGTGDGRWTDDSLGFDGITPMQKAACDYYDSVVERYHLDQSDGDIYLGGHSKGGNETQYTMLASKYGNLVTAVYSMDGQGFPPEVEAQLKAKYGEDEYNARLSRMYSINCEDDPVHQIIKPVISQDNTYYLHASGNGILRWHDLKYAIAEQQPDGTWVYKGLDWQKTNGEYEHGTPNSSVYFAAGIYNLLMTIEDKELRLSVAKGVMGLIDVISGTNLSDPKDRAGLGDYWNFLLYGVPLIGMELLFTPEGHKTLESLILILDNYLIEKFGGVAGPIISAIAVGFITFVAVPFLLTWTLLGTVFKDSIIYKAFVAVTTLVLAKIGIKIAVVIGIVKAIFDLCGKIIDGFLSFIKKHSYAYKYCNNNPVISLNPDTLESYTQRIDSLNRRLQNVEYRIKQLYDQVDLLDKSWVQGADMKIGSSSTLKRAKDYLNSTATEFRNAEKNIDKKLAEVFG